MSPADVTLVCPSHNRAGTVSTFEGFGRELLLCVAEGQLESYKAAYPDGRFDVHPDDVVGIGAKRQWMYEKYGNVFMVDDDLGAMRDLSDPRTKKLKPDVAREVVYRLADMAEQMGATLYGLASSSNPLQFKPQDPFSLKGTLLGCGLGLRPDPNLWFPPDTDWAGEDVWINGLNAHHNRFVLQDLRYAMEVRWTATPGGVASYRTTHTVAVTKERLAEAFGDHFEWKGWVPKMKIPW